MAVGRREADMAGGASAERTAVARWVVEGAREVAVVTPAAADLARGAASVVERAAVSVAGWRPSRG